MDENLIKKVKEHEVLYNNGSHNYRDQHMRQTAWEEIGKELQISANQAKHRWEMLRRCFYNARNRHRHNAKSGSVNKKKSFWKFEQQMSYIIPFLKSRKTQGNLNESNLVTKKSEAKDIVQSQMYKEIEQDVIDFDSVSNESTGINEKHYEAVKYFKIQKQKQNTIPSGQLVEISKKNLVLRKRQYEEKKTHQIESKPASNLETLDDIDLFFLSMSKMTKQLPKLKQSQIKLALSNSVLSAEIRCNQ